MEFVTVEKKAVSWSSDLSVATKLMRCPTKWRTSWPKRHADPRTISKPQPLFDGPRFKRSIACWYWPIGVSRASKSHSSRPAPDQSYGRGRAGHDLHHLKAGELGGGVALTAMCNFRIKGKSARMWVPEVERGFNMSWQSVPRLVNLVGQSIAKRLILLTERLNSEHGLNWCLADEVAEDWGAVKTAMEWATWIAAMPPVQVRMVKQGINAFANTLNYAKTPMNADQFALAFFSKDREEGIAAFLEGRDPNYKGL